MSSVKTNSSLCVRARSRFARCSRCRAVCPTGGIRITGQEVQIEECLVCGLCSTVCPTGVFELQENSDGKILLSVKEIVARWRTVVFACPRSGRTLKRRPDRVEVKCAGRVSPELMVGALGLGAEEVYVYCDASRCAGCPVQSGLEVARSAVSAAAAVLGSFGLKRTVALEAEPPPPRARAAVAREEETYDEGRRALFRSLKGLNGRRLLKAALNTPPAAVKAFTWTHNLPEKRRILREGLLHLKAAGTARGERDFPWPALGLAGGCTFCRACEHLCPSGALRLELRDDVALLWFHHARCTGCGLCLEICPEKALAWRQEFPLADFVTGDAALLGEAAARRCARCAKSYFSSDLGEKYCPSCRIELGR